MKNCVLALAIAIAVVLPAAADDLAVAEAAFGRADRELNTLWAGLKAELSPERFASLRESQRAWISYRDYVADFQMADGTRGIPEKRMKDAGYLEIAAGMTDARVAFLRSWKDTAVDDKTGAWTDSYGGLIEIVEKDGKLFFDLNCVRGPTFHTGSLAGVAEMNGDLARYTDKDDAPEKVKEFGETWLHFEFAADGTLELSAANTGHYHGARAYFEGEYRRVSRLDGKRRAQVAEKAKEGVAEE